MTYLDNLKRFVTDKQLEDFNLKHPAKGKINNNARVKAVDCLERMIISNRNIVNNIEKEGINEQSI